VWLNKLCTSKLPLNPYPFTEGKRAFVNFVYQALKEQAEEGGVKHSVKQSFWQAASPLISICSYNISISEQWRQRLEACS